MLDNIQEAKVKETENKILIIRDETDTKVEKLGWVKKVVMRTAATMVFILLPLGQKMQLV